MRRGTLLVMLLSAGSSISRTALAEEPRFTWSGPACLDGQARFTERLAALTSPSDRARLAGSIAITHQGNGLGLAVLLALDGKRLGERRFSVPSCARAVETAAVAASLAVFEGGEAPAAAAASGISPDMWTRHPEPAPDSPAPPKPPTPPAPYRLRLGLLGAAELGTLPAPSAGGGGTLGLGIGSRWSVMVSGDFTGEQRRAVGERQLVRLRAFAVAGKGCWSPLVGASYRLEGCAGLRLTKVLGSGQGLEVNRSASLAWWAPLLSVVGSVTGGPFEWRIELEASAPLRRQRFLVDEREVMRAKAIVLTARLGPFVRF